MATHDSITALGVAGSACRGLFAFRAGQKGGRRRQLSDRSSGGGSQKDILLAEYRKE